jgi:hypothetical protein
MRTFITAQANQGDDSEAAFEKLELSVKNLQKKMADIGDLQAMISKALEPLAASIAMSQKADGVTINKRVNDEFEGYDINAIMTEA